jgi:hypothetical protein
MMIAESFDLRTMANMEVALERICKVLATGGEQHAARRHIASKILACAESGKRTLGGLTEAGRVAASELGRTAPESRNDYRDRDFGVLPGNRGL